MLDLTETNNNFLEFNFQEITNVKFHEIYLIFTIEKEDYSNLKLLFSVLLLCSKDVFSTLPRRFVFCIVLNNQRYITRKIQFDKFKSKKYQICY